MKWVISDIHLFHKKIITNFTFRPYADVDAMNADIISTINKYVKPNHTLYILGDITFEFEAVETIKLLEQIKCKDIHLIVGNHDHSAVRELPIWKSVNHYLEIKWNKKFFVLCHYPMESWNKSNKGSIMLHGHCHGSSRKRPNRFDVGWDVEHRPVSLTEMCDRWDPNHEDWVDHHPIKRSLWKWFKDQMTGDGF